MTSKTPITPTRRVDQGSTGTQERPAPPLRYDGVIHGEDDLDQLDAQRRSLGLSYAELDSRARWPKGTSRIIRRRGLAPTAQGAATTRGTEDWFVLR